MADRVKGLFDFFVRILLVLMETLWLKVVVWIGLGYPDYSPLLIGVIYIMTRKGSICQKMREGREALSLSSRIHLPLPALDAPGFPDVLFRQ